MRYILSLLIFFLLVGPVVAQNEQDQVIFKAMQMNYKEIKLNWHCREWINRFICLFL